MVERRIVAACEKAHRSRDEVTLIAVSKKFPADAIRATYALGLRAFGENYVQEFAGKHADVADLAEARFHLIGHLQSNKTRVAADIFDAIQTVDSAKLARRLSEVGQPLDVMIEVKLSEEDSKDGASPAELPTLIASVRECSNLRLQGLMTMPPWNEDPEAARPYFQELARLARQLGLAQLSMGMSHDFDTAIEEGATCIRVGTAIFGARQAHA
jgi:PLP dependent protein